MLENIYWYISRPGISRYVKKEKRKILFSFLHHFDLWFFVFIRTRVLKWSRVSRETRLKIGLAISRDLKCKTCKTQKLAKIMHLGRFREGNKAIPHLTSFLWQPKNYVGWKLCYVSHSITCPHSPTLKLPSCVANL